MIAGGIVDTAGVFLQKGDFLQPFVAGINCTLWVGYGFLKPKKDWPIIVANTPGIVFGFTAAFTAVL